MNDCDLFVIVILCISVSLFSITVVLFVFNAEQMIARYSDIAILFHQNDPYCAQ